MILKNVDQWKSYKLYNQSKFCVVWNKRFGLSPSSVFIKPLWWVTRQSWCSKLSAAQTLEKFMPVEYFSVLHLLCSLFYITLHGDYENRANTQRTLRGNTSEASSGPHFVTQHWKECLVYCISCAHYSTSLYIGTMKTGRTLKERFMGTPQKHVLALSLSRNTEKSVQGVISARSWLNDHTRSFNKRSRLRVKSLTSKCYKE